LGPHDDSLPTGGANRVEDEVAAQRRPLRGPPMMEVVEGMDPAVRDRVRQALRASALAARPDFDAARDARRRAIEMAEAESFDSPAVQALLEQSRLAEMRGRSKLETGALEILSTLNATDRKALAPILSRHGQRGKRGDRDRDQTPAPPPA